MKEVTTTEIVQLKRRIKDGWPDNPTDHDGEDWRVAVVHDHPNVVTLSALYGVERQLWYYHLRLQACAKEFFAQEKQLVWAKKDLAAKEKALIDLAERYARDTAELQRRLKGGNEDGQESEQGSGERDPDAAADHS